MSRITCSGHPSIIGQYLKTIKDLKTTLLQRLNGSNRRRKVHDWFHLCHEMKDLNMSHRHDSQHERYKEQSGERQGAEIHSRSL